MKRLRLATTILASLAVSLLGLALAAPSAFAMRIIDDNSGSGTAAPTPTAAHAGMAGWEIALIVAGAVVAVVAVTGLIVRARRRSVLQPTVP
ncbi:MAG: hypothetical protein J2P57_21075 [Acidimicrobiaceae bacterium]|nr:hypothetical protein [Acidimicrobiaceae bacterium]